MTQPSPQPQPPAPRQRLQFSIGGLLMLMVVCSVMATAGSYLVRSLQQGTGASRLVFILFTLVAPIVLLILVSLLRQAICWWQRRGNRRP